ncbi:uncharacterized protein PV09_09240 [Verruconis gallopava]|uniref:FZ domain-containing protein n=1 Tax=Verruconis gallopava TaxID=253628 RepID=A0A0D1YEA5_9PEZI|nr:uncharacterized protein PV09_09240 [Verruconis gallopava]KIV99011.1 hypothetical protein PV09_09240 [Verruconis gallopava]
MVSYPKLTPLQSRFVACLGTSLLLIIIFFLLNPSHFAYAAELDSILNKDHNHHRIVGGLAGDLDWGSIFTDTESYVEEQDVDQYEAKFGWGLVERAPLDTVSLKNNLPNTLNLNPGETQYYVFEQDELSASPGTRGRQLPTNVTGPGADVTSNAKRRKRSISEDAEQEHETVEGDNILEKRQNTKTVYVSANTCLQPLLNENKTGTPGQPTIFYSLSDNNQKPSADQNDGTVQLDQGYAAVAIPNVSGNLYISISAPDLPNDTFTGPWNYQIAASIDDYYHYYDNSTAFMWTVDTDSNSALLATYNLTGQDGNSTTIQNQRNEWMNTSPPFDIYVFNSSSPKIDGIKHSYCGLSKLNMDFMRINTSMTERGVGSNPKQQFYIQSLLPGNTYFSVLAYQGGNVSTEDQAIVGGGGQVWKSMQFSTKSDGNCRVIFDLPFCDAVAYAVPTDPSNSTLSNLTTLSQIYDSNAAALYQNFSLSLQQIPCNTTNSAQYSLSSTCDDCARDYKTWLCAVTIPRCVDFSATDDYLMPRNVGQPFANGSQPTNLNETMANMIMYNSSRSSLIASGPYKEVLPCQELCFNMVKSCPTSLGFLCPQRNALWAPLAKSYGTYDPNNILGQDGILNISGLSCNYLGVDWPTLGNSGSVLAARWPGWVVPLGIMAWMLSGW